MKDIQKLEDIEIRPENCNLKEFISNAAREFSLLATQKNRKFIIQDFSKSVCISTDKSMMLKILENIFDNALRFSHEKIILLIEEKQEYLYFSMQDDGIGFTTEELKSATSFFFRSSANGGSFGIGLSISKILCEKLGGDLYLDNSAEHGAIVTIRIKK